MSSNPASLKLNSSYLNILRILELTGYLYAFTPVVIALLFNVDILFNRTKNEWLYFFYALIPGVVFLIGFRIYFGYYDYRMKVANHFYVLAMILGMFFYSLNVNDIDLSLVVRFVLLAVIGLSVFFLTLFDTTDKLIVVADSVQALSSGDYNYRIEDKNQLGDPIFGELFKSLNQVIMETGALVSNLNATDAIISSTKQLSAISTDISASSEEVASSSQNMAEVANQQAHHVQEIFEKIALLDKTINKVIEQITTNSQVVSQIALQTNILALNAGIEASRAGDYGRGFTVVANNVRKLSEESKAAAENIISVSHIVSETLQSTFSTIRDKIEDISALSEETAASSEEVASVAEEMTSAMEELNQSTDHLAEMANNILQYMEENNLTKLLDKDYN